MVHWSPLLQSCAAASGDCGPGEGEARGGSSRRCCCQVSSQQVGGDGAVGAVWAEEAGCGAGGRVLERQAGSPRAVLRGRGVHGWVPLGRGGSQEELTHFSLGV